MEGLRTFLQSNNLAIDDSDSDSDCSFGSFGGEAFKSDTSSSITSISISKGESGGRSNRQPTRKPDPNVYNRNALLARENRRKKKQHLVSVEKELEEARSANKLLMKALKKQLKNTRRLEQEKQYFRNILMNRTEIVGLISAMNTHFSQSQQSPTNTNMELLSQRASLSPKSSLGTLSVDGSDNGSVELAKSSSEAKSTMSNNFLDDFFADFEPKCDVESSWMQLLGDDDFGVRESFTAQPQTQRSDSISSHITDDHSYVNLREATVTPATDSSSEDSGVCLHIARGKLSLEFCASCHWNACEKPPTQLLEGDCKLP